MVLTYRGGTMYRLYKLLREWQNNGDEEECYKETHFLAALKGAKLANRKGYQTLHKIWGDADFEGILW